MKRRAATLIAIQYVYLAISIVYILYSLFFMPDPALLILSTLVSAGLALLCIALIRVRRVRIAAWVFLLSGWAYISAATFLFGGHQSPLFAAYVLIILVAGSVLRPAAALVFAGLGALAGLIIHGFERMDALPATTIVYGPGNVLVLNLSFFLLAAVILYFFSSGLHDALKRARHNEAALKQTLVNLTETTVSRAYLDNILQSMADMVIVLRPDLNIEHVNQAALNELGYAEAALVGQPLDRLVNAATLHHLLREQPIFISGVRAYECSLICADGAALPVLLSTSIMRDARGVIQGIICVAQDISERQRAEAEQHRQEARYRALVRNLPRTSVMVFDHELRYLLVEGQSLLDAGYKPADMHGKTLFDVLPAAMAERLEPLYQAALNGRERTEVIYDGDQIFEVNALPLLDEEGAVEAGLLVINDITELRRNIEQLTILQRIETELTHQFNLQHVLDMALDAAMRLTRARAGIIRLIEDRQVYAVKLAGDYPDQFRQTNLRHINGMILRVMETKQAQLLPDVTTEPDYVAAIPGMKAQMTIPLISRDRVVGVLNLETDRPHHFTDSVFEFVKLMAARVAVTADNASLYHTAQSQLAEMQALYDRVSGLEQMKTDIIRMAAHDLRNPLNVMKGYLQLLEDDPQLGSHPYLAQMQMAADRMENIAVDILSLERVEQVTHNNLCDPVNLSDLVADIYSHYEEQALSRRQKYHLQIMDAALWVRGDRDLLAEAIDNLIGNAIKYTPDDGAITICMGTIGGSARVEVIDSGFGIPEDAQARLFEPFFRVRTPETRQIDGTGLGLHLVHNIIRRHQGTMRFWSVYQKGSIFGFDLPLCDPCADEATAPAD